jgi:hypothetical protein
MAASGLLIGLFALAAFQDAPPPADKPYPAKAIFDEFYVVCDPSLPFVEVSKAAIERGWEVTIPTPATDIAKFVNNLDVVRSGAVAEAGGELQPTLALKGMVAEEDLWLILSYGSVNGNAVRSCIMLDVHENREIPTEVVDGFLDRPPDRSINEDSALIRVWKPGIRANDRSFTVFNIGQDSPAVDLFMVSGFGLRADLVMKEQQ